ncbi:MULTISPECIES: hypothetical protein [Streptomyces]|uniref:Secreted protein n=1 Tax=Streptomyces katrae TaxID=68223 RepID=A0ABT7GP04_9ACTN|nr:MULTISPECIES: hypothetical protein [Streptomyces]MDK9494991.1 hypothetical protein [Streptomyces katrae]GLX22804.1 hypothetical protein Slala01_64480 [Streptomyces lavendulae subsp. lavendulae]GLX24331.1 hypothetical protein Slala02_01510 [Streptomyces lavendulae subsp. lavendulae]
MSGGEWFLAAFGVAPLLVFAVALAREAGRSDGLPGCFTCGHAEQSHGKGSCRGGSAPEGEPCGCTRFTTPPYEEPRIGCGG